MDFAKPASAASASNAHNSCAGYFHSLQQAITYLHRKTNLTPNLCNLNVRHSETLEGYP
jgi:3-hydroxy-3-methylglutaryl CoA synthase